MSIMSFWRNSPRSRRPSPQAERPAWKLALGYGHRNAWKRAMVVFLVLLPILSLPFLFVAVEYRKADRIFQALNSRIAGDQKLLDTLRSFVGGGPPHTREQWQSVAAEIKLERRFPEIAAAGFVENVVSGG